MRRKEIKKKKKEKRKKKASKTSVAIVTAATIHNKIYSFGLKMLQ